MDAGSAPIGPVRARKCLQMTKEELERYLSQGLTLEQIGRMVGRHASTIGYHAKKHGLVAVHHDKYAGKGGLREEVLKGMAEAGMSWAEMARELDRSQSTIRYWLRKYGLWPLGATGRRAEARRAREQGLRYAELECLRHGRTTFILENRGYHRCMKCRMERVAAWRRRAKRRLIEVAGGACVICGYDATRGRCSSIISIRPRRPSRLAAKG